MEIESLCANDNEHPAEIASDAPCEKRSGALIVLAVLTLAASYLFVSLVPIFQTPVGFLALTIAVWAMTSVFCVLMGGRFGFLSVCATVFGIAAALFRVIRGHADFDLFPVMLLCGLAYAYFVVSMFGNHSRTLGGRFLLDMIKGIGYLFISFTAFFTTLFAGGRDKRSAKKVWITVVGIALAVVLVIIISSLLSYDEHFAKLLPDIEFDSIGTAFLKLHFAIPMAAMVFGLFEASRANKLPKLSSAETADRASEKIKVLPAVIVMIPVFALLAVYALFFISQFGYYVSAFTGALPEGYSAAEYAREGFFQLCAVVCINGVLLALLHCFTKTSGRGAYPVCRALTFLLSLFTLVLIATAVSKMVLYINKYDLTRLRLAVTLFLMFLAVAFTITLIQACAPRIKALPAIIAAAALFIVCFSLVNTNKLIARYNTDAYLGGRHDSIDIEYLTYDLGYSSVQELVRLSDEAPEAEVRAKAGEAVAKIRKKLNEDCGRWYNYSIPYLKAKRLLSGRGQGEPVA